MKTWESTWGLWLAALLGALFLAQGCIGHVFALPLIAYAEAEDAACRSHLPKGAKDPSDGGWLYICRRSHGSASYELMAFPAPGGEIDIPGDETIQNATCGVQAARFGGWCIYTCHWPEGWDVETQEAVPCGDIDAGPLLEPGVQAEESAGASQLTEEPSKK